MDIRVRSWPHFADWFPRDRRCAAVPHPDADAIPDEVDDPVANDVSNADAFGLEHAVRDSDALDFKHGYEHAVCDVHADTDDDIWRVADEHADADIYADADADTDTDADADAYGHAVVHGHAVSDPDDDDVDDSVRDVYVYECAVEVGAVLLLRPRVELDVCGTDPFALG